MKTSVEISMYPLQENYETPILDFIRRLNQYPELEVRTNRMSTQIFGEYDEVMDILNKEIKSSFSEGIPMSLVCKFLNTDR